ncbi:MAG: aminotransferase class V-fold PLP-dependent enzyme [Oscillospiraceae bacterium]|nr:aminotransferase class V-fold PLP-dependent enzyme [Oscillospiraceae bacterium]
MNTPICDFVRAYAAAESVRFHMPGHKGKETPGIVPGVRQLDITEIAGADVLYDARGIIRESEENAARLFGSARTVYSTEGSSLCIRAMLYLALMHAKFLGREAKIAAGRNAHRVFLETAALLDLDVTWLGSGDELLRAKLSPKELEAMFAVDTAAPTAVYVTSPDYLGNRADLSRIAEICHRHGAVLLVDNAHGAYLKFLERSEHPLDCGADLCCDSAHKTLTVLTGGAYLHASRSCPAELLPMMERAMALYASTSPSWLILQSLDAANALLAAGYPERIRETVGLLCEVKQHLWEQGWEQTGDEPLKLTLSPKSKGYTGTKLAELLREKGMVCEFSDPDYLVLMITPENTREELDQLLSALGELPERAPNKTSPPVTERPLPVLRPREALFCPFERIPVEESEGRILASPSVSCPPAVPIVICGERIDRDALEMFRYYGIESCDVIIE